MPSQATPSPVRPVLRAAMRVPFGELEPEPFASFVHGAIQVIFEGRGWSRFQQPDVGADGGFDSSAILSGGGMACIQCKRYEIFSTPHLAIELAKIAMTSSIEGSDVREYLLITSGTFRQIFRKDLREVSRQRILKHALDKSRSEPDLASLRKSLGSSADQVIQNFVTTVALMAWSANEFDIQLGLVWTDTRMKSLLEKTFVMRSVVREHPRPDFDETRYLERLMKGADNYVVELSVNHTTLPYNVRHTAPNNPLDIQNNPDKTVAGFSWSNLWKRFRVGTSILLVGPSGAGKSTAVSTLSASIAASRLENFVDEWLPVPVKPAPGRSLSELVCESMGISVGRWIDVPGPKLLLVDRLDEIAANEAAAFAEELERAIGDHVGAFIFCRNSGPLAPIELPSLAGCFGISPLSLRDVRHIADRVLGPENWGAFIEAWSNTLQQDSYAYLPQFATHAIALFKAHGGFPGTKRGLVDGVIQLRSATFAQRLAREDTKLSRVPFDFARSLASRIAWRFVREGLHRIDTTQFAKFAIDVLEELCSLNDPFAPSVNAMGALAILEASGLFERAGDGTYAFTHATIRDLLASDIYCSRWRDTEQRFEALATTEMASFAAPMVPTKELDDFLAVVFESNPPQACTSAREVGKVNMMIDACVDKLQATQNSSVQEFWIGMLGDLPSDKTPTILWYIAEHHPHLRKKALMSLGMLGNHDAALELLKRAELLLSFPGQASGGEISAFSALPVSVRLQAARQIAENSAQSRLGILTISTLCSLGSEKDAENVVRHLRASVIEDYLDFRAISQLARTHQSEAVSILLEKRDGLTGSERASAECMLSELGESADVGTLLMFVCDPDPNLSQKAMKILENIDFTSRQEETLLDLCSNNVAALNVAISKGLDKARAPLFKALLSEETDPIDFMTMTKLARKIEWTAEEQKQLQYPLLNYMRGRHSALVVVASGDLLLDWGHEIESELAELMRADIATLTSAQPLQTFQVVDWGLIVHRLIGSLEPQDIVTLLTSGIDWSIFSSTKDSIRRVLLSLDFAVVTESVLGHVDVRLGLFFLWLIADSLPKEELEALVSGYVKRACNNLFLFSSSKLTQLVIDSWCDCVAETLFKGLAGPNVRSGFADEHVVSINFFSDLSPHIRRLITQAQLENFLRPCVVDAQTLEGRQVLEILVSQAEIGRLPLSSL